MYAQLGTIIFDGRKSFTSSTSMEETNFAEIPLIENKPRLQRIGSKLDTVNLIVLLDASFCDPQAEIEMLRSARESAEILPLISGQGIFEGNFVIKSISRNDLHSLPDGTLTQTELQIQLLEHFDSDLATAAQVGSIASGFAMAQNNPEEVIADPSFLTESGSASASVVASTASANTGANILSGLASNADLYRQKANTAARKMNDCADQIGGLLAVINADASTELYDRTRDLAESGNVLALLCIDVVSECNALIADIDAENVGDIPGRVTTLITRSVEITNRTRALSSSATSLTALTVTQ